MIIKLHNNSLPGKNFSNYIDSHCFEEMPWGKSNNPAVVSFDKDKGGVYLISTKVTYDNSYTYITFIFNYNGGDYTNAELDWVGSSAPLRGTNRSVSAGIAGRFVTDLQDNLKDKFVGF